jgi:hypothetical protein
MQLADSVCTKSVGRELYNNIHGRAATAKLLMITEHNAQMSK